MDNKSNNELDTEILTKMDNIYIDQPDKKTECIINIGKRIVDPFFGATGNVNIQPTIFSHWNELLSSVESWISMPVSDEEADILREINVGEVVPLVTQSLTLYENYIAPKLMYSYLTGYQTPTNKMEKPYRVIMNYNSFIKFANYLKNMIPVEMIPEYDNDMVRWLKNICDRTFWFTVPVPVHIANELREKNIGEIVSIDGDSELFDKKIKNVGGDMLFRIFMNNRTILGYIIMALQAKGVNINDNVNVHQELAGYSDDLSLYFNNMDI
jgi:hypothetical protein